MGADCCTLRGAAAGSGTADAATEGTVDATTAAKVMKLTNLKDDEDPLTPQRCYKPAADRVLRWTQVRKAVAETSWTGGELSTANAVAVTCKDANGNVVEAVVNSDTMEQCTVEDTTMCEVLPISKLVEAQFENGGVWTTGVAGVTVIEGEKTHLFGIYKDEISKAPPDCLKSLQHMLQAGPITKVYSGGTVNCKPHTGHSLRMPAEEVDMWTITDHKGQLRAISRPAIALRVWSAIKLQYETVDPLMAGAPVTPEAVDAWYTEVVGKLKASPYLGSDLINNMVSCETYEIDPGTERPKEGSYCGKKENRWTKLAVAAKPLGDS